MNQLLKRHGKQTHHWKALVVIVALLLALASGLQASLALLALVTLVLGFLASLAQPALGLIVLVVVSLSLRQTVGTGTEVDLTAAALLVPMLLGIWLLDMVRRSSIQVVPSRANLPLALFLLAGLISLWLGNIAWDPLVFRKSNFVLVQIAQWGIFAFSAGAFWLSANLIKNEVWLRRVTMSFLLVGGGLSILRNLPDINAVFYQFSTVAFIRAPFWVLLTAVAVGQLLFNNDLSRAWQIFLGLVFGSGLLYAFFQQQEAASNWVGLAIVLGILIWLRFPRFRWPIVVLVLMLSTLGILFPAIYQFAGGDAEWQVSGGSRLTLIQRVVEVTMRNPVFGLGPAAYRPYANSRPLSYEGAYWLVPSVNSHNNYVDLFAHVGLFGLALFFWFAFEVGRLGTMLRRRYTRGFAAGYVNGMLATGAASLVIMAFADWILPFVYNIGFPGFQASVLVWLFLGGLVALENMPQPGSSDELELKG